MSLEYKKELDVRCCTDIVVAGRCVGTDRAMQASIRVIPGCYITDLAAGVGASVCVDDECAAKKMLIQTK